MNFTKSGMDLSGLNNVTPLDLNISFSPADIISGSSTALNSEGGVWAIAMILVGLYIMFLWALGETSPLAKFRYSYMRASLLSICIINLISITMISIGLISSFRIVAIFIILNILNTILVLALDN